MKLVIDRTKNFGHLIGYNNITEYFDLSKSDPDSFSVKEFNSDDIELKMTLEGWFNSIEKLNQSLDEAIKAIPRGEYIFADAWMGELLLHHQELIPKKWIEYFDSDWYGPEHGSLRFEGSVFKSKDD